MQQNPRPSRRRDEIAVTHLEARLGAIQIRVLVLDPEQISDSDFKQRLESHYPNRGRDNPEQVGMILLRDNYQHRGNHRQRAFDRQPRRERKRRASIASMELATDPRNFTFELGALIGMKRTQILQHQLPRAGSIAMLVELALDLCNPVADSFALRDRRMRRGYHLKIAAATNASIMRIPNSM